MTEVAKTKRDHWPEVPEVENREALVERLTCARIRLMIRLPFFGNLASRLQLTEEDDWLDTAATDGRRFFYNSKFVSQLTNGNLEFLFGHEILHCAFDHFGRTGSRHRKLANWAQDYVINQILIDDKVGEKITTINILHDDKYRGWAWEDVYDDIYNNVKWVTLEDLDKWLDEQGDILDNHIHGDYHDDPNAPVMSKEEMQRIRDEIREAMIQAAAADPGSTPSGILRMIKDLTEPKMNWRDIVRMNIQSIIKSNYSYARPNKKGWAYNVVLPGLIEEDTIDIAIALDMSGSIGDEDAGAFLSEVRGIIEQYHEFAIDLWCFDTQVYNHVRITQDNIAELEEYEPAGRGGTDFEVNWVWMKDNYIEPKKFFMFTDGYPGGSWGDPDYCDTLFIVKGNTTAVAPFGEVIIYEQLQ